MGGWKSLFLLLILGAGVRADAAVRLKLEAWQAQAPADGAQEPTEVVRAQQRIETDFDFSWERGRWTATLRPRLEVLGRDEGAGRALLEPRETQLSWEPASIRWSAGFFSPVWEGTDGVNPMDIASVRDLRDPLRSSSRASAGVGFLWLPGDWHLEGFWVPRQTSALLPGVDGMWYPRGGELLLASDGIELRLPSETRFRFDENEVWNSALDNNVGFRLQSSFSSFEWGVAAFEGAAQTPLIFAKTLDVTPIELDPRQIFLLRSPVTLSRVDYRRRTGALRLVWSAESWIVRLAGRHDEAIGDDARKPGWSQLGVAGVEKNFFWDEATFTLLLQGAWSRREQGEAVLSLEDLLDRAVMAGFRWAPSENDQLFFSAFRETKQGGAFASLEYQRRLGDHWSASTGVDVIEGVEGTYLGLLRDRDRAKVSVTWSP